MDNERTCGIALNIAKNDCSLETRMDMRIYSEPTAGLIHYGTRSFIVQPMEVYFMLFLTQGYPTFIEEDGNARSSFNEYFTGSNKPVLY